MPVPLPSGVRCELSGATLKVTGPKGWLEAHPLTAADLEQEAEFLRGAGFRLRAG